MKKPTMNRSVINKHYDSASSVTLSSFIQDENKRKGELIVVNDAEHPGLYTVGTNGQIVNLSSQVNIDIDALKELIESLITDVTKQEVLTQEEYRYKVDNNLIDEECMYYVYEDDGGGGDDGGDEFVPNVIDETETLEIDEDGVTGEVATINGTVEGETLIISGEIIVPDNGEVISNGDDYSLVYDDEDAVVGETLIVTSSVMDETLVL